MKKLLFIVSISFLSSTLFAQCPIPTLGFGSGMAPTPGNSAVIETCNFVAEYETVYGVVAQNTYTVNFSGGNGVYVVIYDTTDSPVAWGDTTVQFTAQFSGIYHAAVFMDSLCGASDPLFTCNASLWANTTSNVGIEPLDELALSVFPNPTEDYVSILFEGPSATVSVADVNGRMMYSARVQSGDSIDLQSFDSGVYFFSIQIEGRREVVRVVRE